MRVGVWANGPEEVTLGKHMNNKSNQPVKLFYSYCHKDSNLRDELEVHLSILSREKYIEAWFDHMISPGEEIDNEIMLNLDQSDIIILVISPDFIASDYCYSKELSKALERHQEQKAIVIPIIVRPVKWNIAPFSKLKALPKDGMPVTLWANRDQAWLDVAESIEVAVKSIWKRKEERIIDKSEKADFSNIKELLSKAVDHIDEKFHSEKKYGGIPTSFDAVDELIDGLHAGSLYVIAGRPEMGRTDFVLNIAEVLAVKQKITVAYISTTYTSNQITEKIITSLGYVHRRNLSSGALEDADWPRLTSAISMSSEAPIFINSSDTFDIGAINASLISMKLEKGLGLVVIDSLQHLENIKNPVSVSRELKAIARRLNVPLLVTSRVQVSNNRVDKRPLMQDLGEWQCLEEDADVIIFLYRDEIYYEDPMNKGTVEVIVRKSNHGSTGMAKLGYMERYSKFENYLPEAYEK